MMIGLFVLLQLICILHDMAILSFLFVVVVGFFIVYGIAIG